MICGQPTGTRPALFPFGRREPRFDVSAKLQSREILYTPFSNKMVYDNLYE